MSELVIEKLGRASIMAFSKIGKNHLKDMSCNQDSYAYTYNDSGNYALALADGVSSCVNAKKGSIEACKVVCDLLNDVPSKTDVEMKRQIFMEWKKRIKANWNEFGTTLNFCYLFDTSLVLGKTGDGAVLSKVGGHFYSLVDDNPFYSSETVAFGESISRSSFTIKSIALSASTPVSVLMMTDGICKEIEFEKMEKFADYVFQNNETRDFKNELESWISDLDMKNGDDKSLFVCTWRA